MKLLIRPKLPFKLLGTSASMDPAKEYPAVPAKNIPGWFERKLVFSGPELVFMLEEEDYTITNGEFPKHP